MPPVVKRELPDKAADHALAHIERRRTLQTLAAIRYLINVKTLLPRVSQGLGERVLYLEIQPRRHSMIVFRDECVIGRIPEAVRKDRQAILRIRSRARVTQKVRGGPALRWIGKIGKMMATRSQGNPAQMSR